MVADILRVVPRVLEVQGSRVSLGLVSEIDELISQGVAKSRVTVIP